VRPRFICRNSAPFDTFPHCNTACTIHSLLQISDSTAERNTSLEPGMARYARLFLGLAFGLALFGICSSAIASADTWWHLATGRWIVEHHAIPHTDPFSYATAGKAWVAHEYLTDILMFLLHRAGGFIALATANALLLVSAFVVVAFPARSPRWLAYAAVLFAALAARPAFALRPQSISLVFGAAFLWILRRSIHNRQPKWLIALPCLMLLWVQLHAGYLLGLIFVGLLLAAEALDWICKRASSKPREWLPQVAAGVGCVAVVPLNPNGFTMLTFPFFVMRMKINQTILEWQAPNLHDPYLAPFLLLSVATFLAMLLSRDRYRPGQFLIYAVLLAAALKSARNIPVFCLVAPILLADHLWLPRAVHLFPRFPSQFRAACAGVLLAIAAYFCAHASADGLAFQAMAEKNQYPREAVSYLIAHHPPKNVFNDYTFGGYLIWRLYPEYQVYVDGRADLYGDDFLSKYVAFYNGEIDPQSVLNTTKVQTVILAPSAGMTSLMRLFTVQGSWKLVYEDAHAVIFLRNNDPPS
jgi:hypothetical protein